MLDYTLLKKLYLWTREQALATILEIYEERWSCVVNFLYFTNLMHQRLVEGTPLEHQKQYHIALMEWDVCFADGIALQLFYRRVVHAKQMPHNLNGTDFNQYLFEQLSTSYTVSLYLYQCFDPPKWKTIDYIQKGIDALQHKFPRICVVWSDQCLFREKGKDFDRWWLADAVNRDTASIKIFFNCTGSPFQEIWCHSHEDQIRELGLLCINAWWTIDYLSGFEKRAPRWVVKARVLEALWRVVTRPRKNIRKVLWMFGVVRVVWKEMIIQSRCFLAGIARIVGIKHP